MTTTISYRLMLGVLMCVLLGAAGCDKAADQRKQVQATWDAMKAACENQDGQAALKVYTEGTFEHYGKIVRMGLDGKGDAVFAAGPSAVMEIANMRVKSTRKQLEGLDGRGYVAFAVTEGWWNDSLNDLAIKDIKISGDFADATMYNPALEKEYREQKFQQAFSRRSRFGKVDKPPEYPVKFVRENDGWKFDELSVLPHWDKEILAASNEERQSLRDFVMDQLREDVEKDIPMSVWEPMKK
jgi:hypothetical protein